jgi:hypothetical protein
MEAEELQPTGQSYWGADEYVRDGLIEAYVSSVRPFLGLLIRHGVSHADMAEALKYAFIEAAEEDVLEPEDLPVTDGSVGILAGLSARETKEYRHLEPPSRASVARMNMAATVLSAWHTDPEFTGPYGVAMELDFAGPRSFSALVSKHADNFSPQEMLNELVRGGCAAETPRGTVRALRRAYVLEHLTPQVLNYLGKAINNLAETLVLNTLEKEPANRRFERQLVAETGIAVDQMPNFLYLLQERGLKFLEELDGWIKEKEKDIDMLRKIGDETPKAYPGVGIYLFFDSDEQREVFWAING